MRVTIYTDASYRPVLQKGAWAAWCRSSLGRVTKAALCTPDITSSAHAEMQAAVEGVRLAKLTWPVTTAALVMTDCSGIVPHLNRSALNPPAGIVRDLLRQLDGLDVHIEARWVKGHQDKRVGTQAWLNNAVDGMAGRVLEQLAAPPQAPKDPAAELLRQRTREALAMRYGTDLHGLRAAREWAGKLLGLRRAKIGKLSRWQCEKVLEALESNGR